MIDIRRSSSQNPMTIPITLNLPEDLYRRAERFARLANRDVQKTVLADTLTHSLPPISGIWARLRRDRINSSS
jgi:hypothetical protein